MSKHTSRGKTKPARRSLLRQFNRILGRASRITICLIAAVCITVLFASFPRYQFTGSSHIRPTIIYARGGQELATLSEQYYIPVQLHQIPLVTVHAILAAEDTRFYRHHGLDARGMGRAAWADLRSRTLSQGGSTITQQLVRLELLSDQRTLHRKISEIILALRVERSYTKNQILERYLNSVYFGGGAYGIGAAAQSYFHKPVGQLTPAESALLAGLIRAPSEGNPRLNLEIAMRRQRTTLAIMVAHRWLSQPAYLNALQEKIVIYPRPENTRWRAPYVVESIRRSLIDQYGRDEVYHGDLRVYTTIDYHLQQAAEAAVVHAVQAGRSRGVSNGALVAIEPQTGNIRALVGGKNFWESQYNRATQAHRQPGSSFKVFVYQAALDHGHLLDERIQDAPVAIGRWTPKNYGSTYHGMVTLEMALAMSLNSVAVRLAADVHPQAVITAARQAGITSPLHPYMSIALGAFEVTPIEMARAFATYANGGKSIAPGMIREIRQGNKVIFLHRPVAHQTVNPATAFMLTQGLRSVILEGTGRRANIGIPAAGKTGTSSKFCDAWFIGFTPRLSTAVWLGNDERRPMIGVAGGSLPAQAWAEFMHAANLPALTFQVPPGVIHVDLCAVSGLLAQSTCPVVKHLYMLASKAPTEYCNLDHQRKPAPPPQPASPPLYSPRPATAPEDLPPDMPDGNLPAPNIPEYHQPSLPMPITPYTPAPSPETPATPERPVAPATPPPRTAAPKPPTNTPAPPENTSPGLQVLPGKINPYEKAKSPE